ncbi:flavoprotein [Longispora sp. K20-0274]|uniref:flavoprotein n=1 Tax=Longispora sp. K20-0274 TaxID=3088255 RepID=UPI00399A255C
MPADRLAVVCTGASAALELPAHLTAWRRRLPVPTTVLLTSAALTFVQPTAIRLLADEVVEPNATGFNPVAFAHTARLLVVAPATANFVVSAALGLANSPALTAVLATPAPVVLFPHMHPTMWRARTTQAAVRGLRERGVVVVSPEPTTVLTLWNGEFGDSHAMPGPSGTAKIVEAQWRAAG